MCPNTDTALSTAHCQLSTVNCIVELRCKRTTALGAPQERLLPWFSLDFSLHVTLCECGAWSLLFRGKTKVEDFRQQRAGEDIWAKGGGGQATVKICTAHKTFLGRLNVCGRTELLTGFLWGNLKERHNLEDLGIDVKL